MKVILLADVEGWGSVGDVRDVPAGAGAQHLVDEALSGPTPRRRSRT